MGMGKKSKKKKATWSSVWEGLRAVHLLDNQNIYGVIASEAISNVFKEGMWIKVLSPYALFLSGGDKILVGNTITLNGITRAIVGGTSGRLLIDKWGTDNIFVATGFLGVMGLLVNFYCILQGSITAMFALNFIWAIFNGLWNSCMETEWAKSIIRSKREDVNDARQFTNKSTTAMGPLFSLVIFLCIGNKWTLPLIRWVMLFGTTMTIIPVLLCFVFRREAEVHQRVPLNQVKRFDFPSGSVDCTSLSKADFIADPNGKVKLTCPLSQKSKFGKLRLLSKDLRETKYVLGKQWSAKFKSIQPNEDILLMYFNDDSRRPVRVSLDHIAAFLNSDEGKTLNADLSMVHFELYPDLTQENKPKDKWSCLVTTAQCVSLATGTSLLIGLFKKSKDPAGLAAINESRVGSALEKPLLDIEANQEDGAGSKSKSKFKKDFVKTNVRGANIIVGCDVLNAFATGMSLKFMDLFMIQDYDMSPAAVLAVAVFSNLAAAWLTPVAKGFIVSFKNKRYQSKLAVVAIWSAANVCLGIICIPDMPWWIVIPAIIMFNGLGSSTKAFNRAKLVNYLPQDRIANYMAWDSLNKANQGGVAIFGAQLLQAGGYRLCFMVTWLILFIRIMVYFFWAVSSKRAKMSALESKSTVVLNLSDLDDFDVDRRYSPCAAASELFIDSGLHISRDGELEERERSKSSVGEGIPQVLALDTLDDLDDNQNPLPPIDESPGSPLSPKQHKGSAANGVWPK